MNGFDDEDWAELQRQKMLCKLCGKKDGEERFDAYGIYTTKCCEECYESDRYKWRKDDYYDPEYAGEQLDEEE